MKTNDIIKSPEDFKGYEEARRDKSNQVPQPISNKEIKAAVNRINPDGNTQERG